MMKITEKIFDISTGVETFIEREETESERLSREALEAEQAVRQTQLAAQAQARQALLDKLGITEEEAKLLLGGN
jgi:mevalonate kinase